MKTVEYITYSGRDYLTRKPSKKEFLGAIYYKPNLWQVFPNTNGKAFTINNDDGTITFRSYWTNIINYNPQNHTFRKLWNVWSVTTAKHIDRFFRAWGYRPYGKREWINLPTNQFIDISERRF
jgi:hypothetical protein